MHIKFSEIASKISQGGWGTEYKTEEQAAKAILQDKPALQAYATVELLNRLNKIARAAGPDEQDESHKKVYVPEDPRIWPDVKIGDKVYEGDDLENVVELLVIAKDDDNRCLMIATRDFDLRYPPRVRMASQQTFLTLAEAVRHAANTDLEYHLPKVDLAKRALEAVESNGDLSEYLTEMVADEDDDEDDE